jgi:hypothetical protein
VPKVPNASEYHCHAVFVGGGYDLGIAYGAARLNRSSRTSLRGSD